MRTSRNGFVLALLLLPAGVLRVAAQAPAAALVAGALAAAPESLRAGATVLQRQEDGTTKELRRGTNGLVCLTDQPGDKDFETACYHESLEPFMALGRDLRARHFTRAQVDSARLAGIEAKRLAFPANGTVVYNLAGSADSLDADGTPRHGTRWYVVYTPYATPATTGIPVAPDGTGRPWIMYPGKPWAHLMITPK